MSTLLVVNHRHSPVCGIHDIGRRLHARLAEQVDTAYAEVADEAEYHAVLAEHEPAGVVVNYRADLTPWWRPGINGATTFGIVHNYEPATATSHAAQIVAAGFDRALFLDDIDAGAQAVAIGRPLPPVAARSEPVPVEAAPIVGTFGFAFPHKRFDLVAGAVAAAFDRATFDLHMPEAYFNGASGAPLYGPGIIDQCSAELHPGITMTTDATHLPPAELVEHLAGNDINCLLYQPGQPDAGLSSALDYLVAARRPILVSDCAMFRHGNGDVAVWPTTSLRDVWDDHDAWTVRAERASARLHVDAAAIIGVL